MLISVDTGGIYHRNYLTYNGFAPKNLTNKIDRLIRSCMENGLESFYQTFARLIGNINFMRDHENNIEETTDMRVLGLEQLSLFFVLYGVQISIAIVIFIIELNVYHIGAVEHDDNRSEVT